MRGRFGSGPLGTGAHLAGHRGSWSEPHDVEVWLLVLFLPLLPLARWSVSAAEAIGSGEGRVLELTVHATSRLGPGAALGRVARALGLFVLCASPLTVAVWRIGRPWATPVLTTVLGSLVSAGLLEKVGMAVEMGAALAGAVIPVVALMLLDETLPRVPLRSAMGLEPRGEADSAQ